MGDLQSEEERDIVLEIKLPSVTSPQQDTVLQTTLSYFNVITSEFDMVQSELVLSRGGEKIGASHDIVFVHCCLVLGAQMVIRVHLTIVWIYRGTGS